MQQQSPEEAYRARTQGLDKRAVLRPMAGSECLDLALHIYQRNAWQLLHRTTVPVLLCHSSVAFFIYVVAPAVMASLPDSGSDGSVWDALASLGFGCLVAIPLFCFGIGQCAAAAAQIVHASVVDSEFKPAPQAGPKAGLAALVAASPGLLLLAVAVLAGAVLQSISGIVDGTREITAFLSGSGLVGALLLGRLLAAGSALGPTISVLEGCQPREAVRRSRHLMRATRMISSGFGSVSAINLCLLLLAAPLLATLNMLVGMSGWGRSLLAWNLFPGSGQMLQTFVSSLPLFMTLWFLIPAWSLSVAVVYYDRAVRKEAYDVKVMLHDISTVGRRSVLLR